MRFHEQGFVRDLSSGDLCGQSAPGLSGRAGGRLVPFAEASKKVVDRYLKGVGECVPALERSDGATLLDLDESASGQAAAVGELLVGPAAFAPQSRKLQAEGDEVWIGREGCHLPSRRCRALPCQCRPLPYFRW